MSDDIQEIPNEENKVETPVETPEEVKETADHSWVPKRISEITAARRAAEARAAELESELQRLRASSAEPTPSGKPEDIEALAKAYAERMVREQTESHSINSKIAAINEAGSKEFGDQFEKSVENLRLAGIGGADFLKVLANVPKPETVVTWLGKSENLNEAMRVSSLDPVQMAIELTKLSGKAVKAFGKQVSNAPKPIEPLNGGSVGDSTEPDPKDTAAWLAWRQKNKKTRR